jgi:hypothetical protein
MKLKSATLTALLAGFLATSAFAAPSPAVIVRAQTGTGTLTFDETSGQVIGKVAGLGCLVISPAVFESRQNSEFTAWAAAKCPDAISNPQAGYQFSPTQMSNSSTIEGSYQGPCSTGQFQMLNVTPENAAGPKWYLKLNGITANFCQ